MLLLIILSLREGVHCWWWPPIFMQTHTDTETMHKHTLYIGFESCRQQIQTTIKASWLLLDNSALMTLLLNTNYCSRCCWAKRAACPVRYRSIVGPVEVRRLYSCWTWARRVKGMRGAMAGVDADRMLDEEEKHGMEPGYRKPWAGPEKAADSLYPCTFWEEKRETQGPWQRWEGKKRKSSWMV